MDRRQFCRSTLAASFAAAYPFLAGCEKKAPVATQAEAGIAAVSLDGVEIELEKAAIRELGEQLTGPVLLSGHPDYDSARRVWNGMHDKRPALIARCASSEDIHHAVTFARERDLLVAVRGGGHSWPGKSVCDGGLMIDLAHMNSVTVDPVKQRAFARGGALLGQLDTAALEHGLITTAGVVSHTGVGGYTLGGGFGRLNRKHGLTIDNLVSAEIITADGQVRTVSAEQDADLFWAIRGGGGNFGVVSQFEYQLHPFNRSVLSGMIAGMQDYMVMQTQEDANFAHGIRSYAKNGMVKEISPELIDAMIESFVPDPRMAMFTHTAGGAVTRVDEEATAFPHRNAETMIIIGGGWKDPAHDAEAIAIGRKWFAQLEPFTGGYYDNIEFDSGDGSGNYGPVYERLARIKGRYDPGNLFRLNRNIQPAT